MTYNEEVGWNHILRRSNRPLLVLPRQFMKTANCLNSLLTVSPDHRYISIVYYAYERDAHQSNFKRDIRNCFSNKSLMKFYLLPISRSRQCNMSDYIVCYHERI